jgi:hypothetical protein
MRWGGGNMSKRFDRKDNQSVSRPFLFPVVDDTGILCLFECSRVTIFVLYLVLYESSFVVVVIWIFAIDFRLKLESFACLEYAEFSKLSFSKPFKRIRCTGKFLCCRISSMG